MISETKRHKLDVEQQKFQLATQLNDWTHLLAYPYLLYAWQHHSDITTVKQIATIASHKLGRHRTCNDKCKTVEVFIKRCLYRDILNVLRKHVTDGIQQPLFTT